MLAGVFGPLSSAPTKTSLSPALWAAFNIDDSSSRPPADHGTADSSSLSSGLEEDSSSLSTAVLDFTSSGRPAREAAQIAAEQEEECIEAPGETLISFADATVEVDNLGGLKSSKSPAQIVIGNVGTAPDGTNLKLKVQALSDYSFTNVKSAELPLSYGGFLKINTDTPVNSSVPGSSFDDALGEQVHSYLMEFCFHDAASDQLKELSSFEMTVFDLDHTGPESVRECITGLDADSYTHTDDTFLEVVNEVVVEGSKATTLEDDFGVEYTPDRLCAKQVPFEVDNPKSPNELTVPQMAAGVSFMYRDTSCFNLKLQNTCCGDKGRHFYLAGRSEVSPPRCPTKLVAHGDPMFKVPGQQPSHFWVEAKQLTPLLEWRASDGARMVLSGKTFERSMHKGRTITKNKRNQWFDQFVLTHNGDKVLDVAAKLDVAARQSSFGTMQVLLDERVIKDVPLRGAAKLYSSAKQAVKVTASKLPERLNIGDKHAEKLDIEAGGVKMTIYSSKAGKFAWKKNQKKFMHLNIAFNSGIPRESVGLFAQLAGVEPMSQSTKALMQPVKEKRAAKKGKKPKHARPHK